MEKRNEKHSIIAEYLSGGISARKLGRKYGYAHITISRWIMAQKKYGKQPPEISKAIFKPDDTIPSEVKALQEALRLSRLKIDLLEAMIDISDEQFGTDIRKKAGTSPS
jgi:transposase-like protein